MHDRLLHGMILFQKNEAWSAAPGLSYPRKGVQTASGISRKRERVHRGAMMRKPKQDDITRGAVRQSQGRPQASTSIWRFGEWLSRRIWRSCSAGMWTIN